MSTLLQAIPGEPGQGPWGLLGGPLRLSLAGAQDKLVVVREAGRWRLPRRGEPSTHLLKPDSQRLPGSVELEALAMQLAAGAGLPVAECEYLQLAGQPVLAVRRFDRRLDRHGQVERWHQEDFCQALGLPAELKYQGGGGPTLAAMAELIRTRLRLGPAALSAFLDWVLCAVLLGNADAHGKNLALLHAPDGRTLLAPYYDLVPTLYWSARLVERSLALRIGSARRVDAVVAADWRQFALDTGFGPGFVLRRLQQLAQRLRAAMPEVIARLAAQGADSRRLQRAGAVIETQLARASA